jgi:hypothetical protein
VRYTNVFDEEAGTARDGTVGSGARPGVPKAPGVSGWTGAQARRLEQAGQRSVRRAWTLGARAWRWLDGGSAEGINPKNIIWIFGAGRTGSTWLSQMMGEVEGYTVWFEPWVGMLFDTYHLRLEERKGKHFILSPHYKETWLRSIRSLVLDGAGVRFPDVGEDGGYLVIKEPGGGVGAPLLMEALPESRMVLLVRDPRDVVASWIDALKEGGWRAGRGREEDPSPANIIDQRSKSYLYSVGNAKRAYEAHRGRKVLIRYEELRADTLGTMRRIYEALKIPANEGELLRAVEKYSWGNIPKEEKGENKFYRKASPGAWREDLTPEQVEEVEKITAPLLNELYPS